MAINYTDFTGMNFLLTSLFTELNPAVVLPQIEGNMEWATERGSHGYLLGITLAAEAGTVIT